MRLLPAGATVNLGSFSINSDGEDEEDVDRRNAAKRRRKPPTPSSNTEILDLTNNAPSPPSASAMRLNASQAQPHASTSQRNGRKQGPSLSNPNAEVLDLLTPPPERPKMRIDSDQAIIIISSDDEGKAPALKRPAPPANTTSPSKRKRMTGPTAPATPKAFEAGEASIRGETSTAPGNASPESDGILMQTSLPQCTVSSPTLSPPLPACIRPTPRPSSPPPSEAQIPNHTQAELETAPESNEHEAGTDPEPWEEDPNNWVGEYSPADQDLEQEEAHNPPAAGDGGIKATSTSPAQDRAEDLEIAPQPVNEGVEACGGEVNMKIEPPAPLIQEPAPTPPSEEPSPSPPISSLYMPTAIPTHDPAPPPDGEGCSPQSSSQAKQSERAPSNCSSKASPRLIRPRPKSAWKRIATPPPDLPPGELQALYDDAYEKAFADHGYRYFRLRNHDVFRWIRPMVRKDRAGHAAPQAGETSRNRKDPNVKWATPITYEKEGRWVAVEDEDEVGEEVGEDGERRVRIRLNTPGFFRRIVPGWDEAVAKMKEPSQSGEDADDGELEINEKVNWGNVNQPAARMDKEEVTSPCSPVPDPEQPMGSRPEPEDESSRPMAPNNVHQSNGSHPSKSRPVTPNLHPVSLILSEDSSSHHDESISDSQSSPSTAPTSPGSGREGQQIKREGATAPEEPLHETQEQTIENLNPVLVIHEVPPSVEVMLEELSKLFPGTVAKTVEAPPSNLQPTPSFATATAARETPHALAPLVDGKVRALSEPPSVAFEREQWHARPLVPLRVDEGKELKTMVSGTRLARGVAATGEDGAADTSSGMFNVHTQGRISVELLCCQSPGMRRLSTTRRP